MKRLLGGLPALALIVVAFFAGSAILAARDLQRGVAELQRASEMVSADPATWTPERLRSAKSAQQRALSALSRRMGLQ